MKFSYTWSFSNCCSLTLLPLFRSISFDVCILSLACFLVVGALSDVVSCFPAQAASHLHSNLVKLCSSRFLTNLPSSLSLLSPRLPDIRRMWPWHVWNWPALLAFNRLQSRTGMFSCILWLRNMDEWTYPNSVSSYRLHWLHGSMEVRIVANICSYKFLHQDWQWSSSCPSPSPQTHLVHSIAHST